MTTELPRTPERCDRSIENWTRVTGRKRNQQHRESLVEFRPPLACVGDLTSSCIDGVPSGGRIPIEVGGW